MMWFWGDGVSWWGWLVMAVGMVAFWGLIVWAVWAFAAALRRPPEGRGPVDPRRILDERLARGEIDPEEYRRLRDLLSSEGAAEGRAPVGSGDRR